MIRKNPERKRAPPPEVEKNRMEIAAAAAAAPRRLKKQKRNKSVKSQLVTEDDLYLTYFKPNEFLIFNAAYGMFLQLVHEPGSYKKKLLDLGQCSINDGNPSQYTAPDLINLALEKVKFAWADPRCNNCARDEACTFTSYCEQNGGYVPLIAISSSFMENDYPVGEEGTPNEVTSTEDLRTKLFLLKKLKHQFCHVVIRILRLIANNNFPKTATPEKYTPRKQRSGRILKAEPEVGDHDEEEDTGGPILPLYFNQKLSEANPLCVFFDHKYFKLTDGHVQALLQLEVYKNPVELENLSHFGGLWSPLFSRACQCKIYGIDFFSNPVPRTAIPPGAVSSSSSSSIPSSPGKPNDSVHEFDDSVVGDGTAAWRNQKTPFKIPDSCFLSKSNSEELSLTDESAG